ncbi:CvpA family protein [Chloroflexota bacterium]
MNWVDIVLLVVICISGLIGMKTGLIRAGLSWAGLIVGVILAGRYYVALAGQLTFITHEGTARIAAFVIILIGTVLIAVILASILERAVSMMLMGWVNRLGGALFGLLLAAVFCGAILAIWMKFMGVPTAIAQSGVATLLVKYFPLVLSLLPDEFDAVRSFFQ